MILTEDFLFIFRFSQLINLPPVFIIKGENMTK